MIEGRSIIHHARCWLGVRWQHQGRGPQGVDCVGLCLCVAQDLGFEIADVRGYPRRQDGRQLMVHLGEILHPIRLNDWQQGDIGVFRDHGFPIHVGFLAVQGEENTVLHAHARRRKVVEEPVAVFGTPFAVYRLKG